MRLTAADLREFLKTDNLRSFAWKPEDDTNTPKDVLLRTLNIKGIKLHGFRGGRRTNSQLQNLGYVIVEDHCPDRAVRVAIYNSPPAKVSELSVWPEIRKLLAV